MSRASPASRQTRPAGPRFAVKARRWLRKCASARPRPPTKGASTSAAAGLVDAELAAGSKSGYAFRYVIVGASAVGAPARYALAATPLIYGTTGRRSFFVDENGLIHGADRQGTLAGPSDPRVQ